MLYAAWTGVCALEGVHDLRHPWNCVYYSEDTMPVAVKFDKLEMFGVTQCDVMLPHAPSLCCFRLIPCQV